MYNQQPPRRYRGAPPKEEKQALIAAKTAGNGRDVARNVSTTAVIARNEAIAHTALCLRCLGDCFILRNDGCCCG
jgi:hypothetical protein